MNTRMHKALLYAAGLAALFMVGFWTAVRQDRPPEPQRRAEILMGTVVEIQVRRFDNGRAQASMERACDEIRRLDALFSRHDPRSPVHGVNERPAGVHTVPAELFRILQDCDRWWRRTGGVFDASLGALIDVWGFSSGSPAVPSADRLREAREKAGWRHVRLEEGCRIVRSAPVRFDFGAIVKGYAVDRVTEMLRQEGATEALVRIGGEIRATGGDWIIGIRHPRQEGGLLGRLNLRGKAVSTSGDYEQYFEEGGRRYSHVLDPRTGRPADACQAVTVIAGDGEEADALSTALFVLGPVDGMRLVQTLPGVEALFVDRGGNRTRSSGFPVYLVQ